MFVDDEETKGKINLDDLYERQKTRDLKQLSIFNKILNRIHKRILVTARSKRNEHHVWFTVPHFIFGEPCYENSSCVAYLISQLKSNGFSIRYVHPNTLYISWDGHVPAYVRTEIKKKTGVVVNERGEIVSGGSGSGDDKKDDPATTTTTTTPPSATASAANKASFNKIGSYRSTGVYDALYFEKMRNKLNPSIP